jgi:hypothetical protein
MALLSLEIGVALLIIVGLSGSAYIGVMVGRRTPKAAVESQQFGIIQGAILALLGLLLGFSFSGAMSRFSARQDIIVAEANAVGTAFLRADLFPDPHRGAIRSLLREYTDARLELFARVDADESAAVLSRLASLQGRLWAAAVAAAREKPEFTIALLNPVNEVIDLLAVRNAAAERHLPGVVFGSIVACAMTSLALVGFAIARSDRRLRASGVVLGVLIAATLWITLDLDYPRAGLIRITDSPLRELRAGLEADFGR